MTSFFVPLYFLYSHLPSYRLLILYLISFLLLPCSSVWEKHSCMSSTFPIGILNGTYFFLTMQLHRHKRCLRQDSLVGFFFWVVCWTVVAIQWPSRRLHHLRLFFPSLNGAEHGSQPSLTTNDRELVSVLEVRIEPGDLNPRHLTPQSVTLPTIPQACNFWLLLLLWLSKEWK